MRFADCPDGSFTAEEATCNSAWPSACFWLSYTKACVHICHHAGFRESPMFWTAQRCEYKVAYVGSESSLYGPGFFLDFNRCLLCYQCWPNIVESVVTVCCMGSSPWLCHNDVGLSKPLGTGPMYMYWPLDRAHVRGRVCINGCQTLVHICSLNHWSSEDVRAKFHGLQAFST